MCSDHSALGKPEMQIFCWFSFPIFPLVQFSPSPFLGSGSTFKTFMCGHLCMMTFLHLKNWRCKFSVFQFSPSPILGSVSMFKTIMHGNFSVLRKPEMRIFHWFSFLNFPLVQFYLSPILGSVSMFKTFMHEHLCMVTFLH